MRAERPAPSLRRRLLLNMLVPAAALAVALGGAGLVVIHDVVETTQDRLLDGSALAIAERLSVDDDDELNLDLPPSALAMLESQAGDQIFYGVSYEGALVTGYRRLPLPVRPVPVGATVHRDAIVDGEPVRVTALSRLVYGRAAPVLVQVAETRNARRRLQSRLLAGLAGLEAGLLGLVGALAFRAIRLGLEPLTRLSAEIGARTAIRLAPLPLAGVPVEARAPVEAFNTLLERLDAAMNSIQRFTADASHQLRTPLAALRMHLALLDRALAAGGEAAPAVGEIDRATRRMEHLIVQLLELARADERAAGPDSPITMDLAPFIAEIVRECAPLAISRGMQVEFERPEGQVPIQAVPGFVSEIARNLIDNAVAYNRTGGRVVVRVLAGPGPCLQVEDEGPGIPVDEREKVFGRFYRGSQAGMAEGSGLGLAIVRLLADRMGASVVLSDPPAPPGLRATVVFNSAQAIS